MHSRADSSEIVALKRPHNISSPSAPSDRRLTDDASDEQIETAKLKLRKDSDFDDAGIFKEMSKNLLISRRTMKTKWGRCLELVLDRFRNEVSVSAEEPFKKKKTHLSAKANCSNWVQAAISNRSEKR